MLFIRNEKRDYRYTTRVSGTRRVENLIAFNQISLKSYSLSRAEQSRAEQS